ncbi:hypothetical protein SUDANB105_06936 [Streptomyces sp. enrichment culture]|uniref:hypothetical protein n=1 Tax=Streptomyces sp. enrichment culture TaxID=1795815 RepID=UPI003F55B6A4
MADALRSLTEQGRLPIPDPQVAIMRFYGLLVFPHMVLSPYGTRVDDDLTDRLITSSVTSSSVTTAGRTRSGTGAM